MSTLRVLAVDDEPLALRRLEWCLQQAPGADLIACETDPRRALELIRARTPDVVLLDVEMPELDGFELIDEMRVERAPEVVFVTAFDHFAVRAFAASAVDYLLKPVEPERLRDALERVRQRRELRDAETRLAEMRNVIDKLRADRRGEVRKPYQTELWIREGDARVRIPLEQVDRFEADGDYVRVHVGQRVRLLRARFSELAARLDPEAFVRVHRSEIIRHDLVAALRRCESGRTLAVLSGGREIPVSRRYLTQITRALRSNKRTPGG